MESSSSSVDAKSSTTHKKSISRSRPTSARQSQAQEDGGLSRKKLFEKSLADNKVDGETSTTAHPTLDETLSIDTHIQEPTISLEEPNPDDHSDDEEAFEMLHNPENPTRITARLISEKCLSQEELDSLTRDEITDRVLQVKNINLENCNIFEMENLECYSLCTHLYLQHNHIKEISDQFIFMPELLFLALFDNKILRVEHLRELTKLQFLDISQNHILKLDIDELPLNLQYLNMSGNPFCADEGSYQFYRDRLIKNLPKLVLLDKIVVTREERERLGAPVDEQLYSEGGLVEKLSLQMPTQELRTFEKSEWKMSDHYAQTEEKLLSVRFERSLHTNEDKKDVSFQEARNRKLYDHLQREQLKFREGSKERLLSVFANAESKLETTRSKFQQQIEEQKVKFEEMKQKFRKEIDASKSERPSNEITEAP